MADERNVVVAKVAGAVWVVVSMARPRKNLNEREIERMAGIGCTVDEIATVMECSKRHLETRFCASIKRGREAGKHTLRRMQMKAARGGNVTMLIWLGKQMLGQRDRLEHSGQTEIRIVDETEDGANHHDHGINGNGNGRLLVSDSPPETP